jgi:hypothetical protein
VSRRLVVLGLALVTLLAAGGCDRVRRLIRGARGGAAVVVDERRAALGESLGGLAVDQQGPMLSWEPVPGAVEYAVQVTDGERGRWSWMGAATKVRYGVASASDPDLSAALKLAPKVVVKPRAGARYRWSVTALDADGHLLSFSPMAEFTAKDGVSAPPKAPRQIRVPTGAAAGGPPPTTPAALLTDAKLRAFIAYQRETAGSTGDAMKLFLGAAGKAPGGRAPDAASFNARNEAALKKAGLTQDEAAALSLLVGQYYASRTLLPGAQAALAQAKATGRPGVADDVHRETVQKAEAARAAFGARHGAAALAVVDRHEAEYRAVSDVMMKSLRR